MGILLSITTFLVVVGVALLLYNLSVKNEELANVNVFIFLLAMLLAFILKDALLFAGCLGLTLAQFFLANRYKPRN